MFGGVAKHPSVSTVHLQRRLNDLSFLEHSTLHRNTAVTCDLYLDASSYSIHQSGFFLHCYYILISDQHAIATVVLTAMQLTPEKETGLSNPYGVSLSRHERASVHFRDPLFMKY